MATKKPLCNYAGSIKEITATDILPENAPQYNLQPGTTYTLQKSDLGKIVVMTNAAANTVTVPTGLGAFYCGIRQGGAGQTQVVAASGITINNADGQTKLAKIHANASIDSPDGVNFNLSGYTA